MILLWFGSFGNNLARSQFRGLVYDDPYFEPHPCTHSLQSWLPVWGKITITAHVYSLCPPALSSFFMQCWACSLIVENSRNKITTQKLALFFKSVEFKLQAKVRSAATSVVVHSTGGCVTCSSAVILGKFDKSAHVNMLLFWLNLGAYAHTSLSDYLI